MSSSLRISEEDYRQIRRILLKDSPKENGAFLLVGENNVNGGVLLVRRVLTIPEDDFDIKEEDRLVISAAAINGLVSLCQANNLGLVMCHCHDVFDDYSRTDDYGEGRIAKTLRQFMPDAPIGSMLLTPRQLKGRIWQKDGTIEPLSSLTIVGNVFSEIALTTLKSRRDKQPGDEIYDRQIRAFGSDGQRRIQQFKVGVVGLGGTGSCVVEQLARLGVQDFVIIDKDIFEPSNITRVYGSGHNHETSKRPISKVIIARENLKDINPEIKIRAVFGNVAKAEIAKELLDRDLIFGCTDDHWGRSILNQIAYQYLIPVIDMGVQIDSKDGTIIGAAGGVRVLRPGKPCLWCYDFLKAERIRNESIPITVLEPLVREGYVQGLESPAPSVISLTTTIAGVAVTQFIQLATGFLGSEVDISCVKYDLMETSMWRGAAKVQSGCECQKVKAFGDIKSLSTI